MPILIQTFLLLARSLAALLVITAKNFGSQIVFVQHYEVPGACRPGGSGNSLHDFLSSTCCTYCWSVLLLHTATTTAVASAATSTTATTSSTATHASVGAHTKSLSLSQETIEVIWTQEREV